MIHKMPHKVRNGEPLPGQIVNKVPENTLTDYLVNKELITDRKKLTFDEWWSSFYTEVVDGSYTKRIARRAWKAAQENK